MSNFCRSSTVIQNPREVWYKTFEADVRSVLWRIAVVGFIVGLAEVE